MAGDSDGVKFRQRASARPDALLTRVPYPAVWQIAEVVDVDGPAFAARTYREQAELRRYLGLIASRIDIGRLADVGCGFGRLTPVLAEFGDAVGFEREPAFVDQARALWPEITFHGVASLAELPADTGAFDAVLTFTVLQHLIDPVARRVCGELRRVLSPRGFVLACEETDPRHVSGDVQDADARVTVGRSVARYQELMAPLRLIATSPRRIEPTYHRPDVGSYMLFCADPALSEAG